MLGLHLCLMITCKSTINKAAQDQRSCKESLFLSINVVNRVGSFVLHQAFHQDSMMGLHLSLMIKHKEA